MCGRFVQFSAPAIYREEFALDRVCAAAPRYNIAPTQEVLCIRAATDGTRDLARLRWGLVPGWSQGPDRRYAMINARAETLAQRPAYRAALRLRRCLIPTEGFYEWRTEADGKQPYFVRLLSRRPFALAGLWEHWQGPDGQVIDSCTLVVTGANSRVREIHDRMPVILPREAQGIWLDPRIQDPAAVLPLLGPYPAAAMEIQPVSRQVNSPVLDHPGLVEPLAAS